MGQPAARQTDMTAHGGTISVGCPTVFIGGMPAARVLDMHTCPMATPGTPPVPHVGGPISKGSTGVFIGKMPAARVGDMAVCVGPPDTIALGCMTVFIGEIAGGGGGGGGAASNAGAASASGGASSGAGPQPHWIDLRFVDGGGRPIAGVAYTLQDPAGATERGELTGDGRIRREAMPEAGSCTVQLFAVTNARWSAAAADADEELTLSADVAGFEDGTPATVTIIERDIRGSDVEIEVLETEVSGARVEVAWTYPHPEEEEPGGTGTRRGYSCPQHYFVVRVASAVGRSDFLRLRDWLEIELHDEEGEAMAGEPYVVYLPDGSLREGELDDHGQARLEGLSVRTGRVEFPRLGRDAREAQAQGGEGTAGSGSGDAGSGAGRGAGGSASP